MDICVKNCGYPFHLQISRKEFLNELVRRFPEKPPIAYTRVQSLILQAIQEWWETICCTSKYKDDLGYIRDMHRLLNRKGYVFPEISASEAAVLNPSDSLQSASELEKEERDAQEAKLQELIRRGTPADLQEANRLMKVMAGFQDQKTNYRAKVAEEVDKVRRKAELLDEMLANATPGADLSDDDVYSDIVSSLKMALPKLKSLVQEEHDDEEAVHKLLSLNDYLTSLLEKYKYLKQKDVAKANSITIMRPSNVEINTNGKSSSGSNTNGLSLIDFGDDDDAPAAVSATSPPSSSSATPSGGSGSIDLLSQLGGLNLNTSSSSSTNSNNSNLLFSQSHSKTPSASASSNTNTDLLASLSISPQQNNNISLFTPSSPPPSTNTPTTTSSSSNGPNYDILRSLSSPKPQQSVMATSPIASPPVPSNAASNSFDDWNFASPAPAPPSNDSLPHPSTFSLLDDGTLNILGTVTRDSANSVHLGLSFSNKSLNSDLSNINIQLAVKREFSIRLDPLSATTLSRFATNGITQNTYIGNVNSQQDSVKLRWKTSYTIQSTSSHVEKDGVATLPAV